MAKPDLVDALFAVRPGEFVRRRNLVAKELRKAGDSAKVHEVMRLRRPPLPVWLANHLGHEDADGVTRFIAAVTELRRAHLGEGDLATAMEHQRRALEALNVRGPRWSGRK